jgi:tRNA A-37 threonylcarbamoyl transferase component Bud32
VLLRRVLWGKVPYGYRQIREGKETAFVLNSQDLRWDGLILGGGWHSLESRSLISGGRSAICLFRFQGESVVAREYLHGGLRETILKRHFVTWPPRPVRELILSTEVKSRGIPVMEVLGVRVSRGLGPFYAGTILTRYIPDSMDLWTFLKSFEGGTEARERFLVSVGRFLKRVHAAGVYHGDLNLRNLLVQGRPPGETEILLIDLDRSAVKRPPLSRRLARRNLRRLVRSARKLDPTGSMLSSRHLDLIMRSYETAPHVL